ncbi:MAG: hypothetical protein K2Y29_01165, partial [Beijerinckiaceae bacterium]|nr:hypothetical protein [Beijerinckiaceae bacterium]
HMNAINRVVVPLNGYEVLIRDAMQDYLIGFRQSDEASCTLIVFDGQMTVDGWGLRDRAQKWGMPKSTYDETRKRALNACCVFLNGRGKAVL